MARFVMGLICALAVGVYAGFQAIETDRAFGQQRQDRQEQRDISRRSESGTIMLQRCKISLIDEVQLATERSGVLAFVEPREGDSVRAGQKVAGLRDMIAHAQLRTAQIQASNDIEIRFAKKSSEVAAAEYKMHLDINRKVPGTVPGLEVLKFELAAQRGKLQIEQAKYQNEINQLKVEESKAALRTFSIEAPFDGIVTKVFKKKGEAVREGEPILEIVSTRRVKVEGDLSIKHALIVKQGTSVKVRLDTDAGLDEENLTFPGRIVFVDVKADPVLEVVRVWAEVENENNTLRSGLWAIMTVEMEADLTRAAAKR